MWNLKSSLKTLSLELRIYLLNKNLLFLEITWLETVFSTKLPALNKTLFLPENYLSNKLP